MKIIKKSNFDKVCGEFLQKVLTKTLPFVKNPIKINISFLMFYNLQYRHLLPIDVNFYFLQGR